MTAGKRTAPVVVMLDGDNMHLLNLCGPLDENLQQIARAYDVTLARRGARVSIRGDKARQAGDALQWFHQRAVHKALTVDDIQLGLVELDARHADASRAAENKASATAKTVNANETTNANDSAAAATPNDAAFASGNSDAHDGPVSDTELPLLRTRKSDLRPRTPRQHDYLSNILGNDITFGYGPAGTGKTWLAVACAIDALERQTVERLILTRPAVEAGERLGFLPGDLAQKVDPYLRPLFDALYDLMGFDRVQRLFEKQSIEIAPLAYMRGRTLNHAFVILDEAQNTTPEQMKMFLTRIGFGSKAVINGDPSQVDLPKGQRSGLSHAIKLLGAIPGIATTQFGSRDVVRHPLVARIVDAYEKASAGNTPGA
jgi:phosphate starvation-inducible PhoH-like protein